MNKVQVFYDAISTNKNLKSKLDILGHEVSKKAMTEAEAEAFIVGRVIPVAKEFGFDISYSDLLAYENSACELNDEDLSFVSGGVKQEGTVYGVLKKFLF